ncbi:hypothetical protein [Anthocerotibacter panamensis]|uniref:hypothetical protein n=1 Tax=Anthocerotibacter panamensis TaxID=2857077 RepID=UPI001C40313F|nr:hypothetical protein [Anthocerotibacter panamensis]
MPLRAQLFDVQAEREQQPQVSGVIVDARGLNFSPSVAMRLFNRAGAQVYTTPEMDTQLDTDTISALGTALYAFTIEEAKSLVHRVGLSPMVVRALGMKGGDLVLSNAQSTALLNRNEKDHFLNRFSVVVVWDGPK